MNQPATRTAPAGELIPQAWWKLWENPIIIRYARSRLRLRHSLGWMLAVLILSAFFCSMIYLTSVNRELASSRDAARGVLLPLFTIQGIILMLMGTGSVASGLVQDRISGTIDYQRLTPMSPLAKIVGYLFGLPIREYVLFAITLPFTLFGVVVGQVPISAVFSVYLIFFTSVMLYHMTGMTAAMTAKRWRYTARLTQGLVILLYLILPQFSHLGLYGFQYLTVRPVLAAELYPMIPPEFLGSLDASWRGIDSVPFFTWKFSSFVFSLVLQLMLVGLLGTMCYRKWRDQHQHALSKRFGVGFFAFVAIMILGNLWPILTRDTRVDLPILGGLGTERVDEGVGVMLPLILSYALLGAAMWVLQLVTPLHHEVLRGWRRIVKFNQSHLGWWANESPAGLVVALLVSMALVAVGTELWLLQRNGFFPEGVAHGMNFLALPLALAVAVLSYYAALISLENRRMFMVMLLVWGLPILVATLLGAAFRSYHLGIYVAALSPVMLLLYGATYLQSMGMDAEDVEIYLQSVKHAYWVGLLVQSILIGFLLWRWSGLCSKLVTIARSGSRDIPSSLLEPEIEE
jgi:hypothetical protein